MTASSPGPRQRSGRARRPAGAGPRVEPREAPGETPTHLVIGRILAPWGYRGQVRVEILTDFPERFSRLQEVDVGTEHRRYRVQSARRHKGSIVLKLEGVDDPEHAGELRGKYLYVPLAEAMPLGKDEYYHYQILGLQVYTDDGRHLGPITDILETGSNDVYVVQADGREILIPALADVVQEVDLEHQRLIVTLPPGLMEEEEA